MKKSNVLIFLLLLTVITNAQNVGISTSGAVPDASAMLDIVSTDKGLLVPRVALTALNAASPITSPLTSLLVYNSATAGTTPNNVIPGYYYWDGTKWVAFAGNGGKDWALLGNAGTTAGTNFLGTTDNVDLQFRVNNIQGGLINIANNQTYFGYQAGLANAGSFSSYFGSQAGKLNTGVSNSGFGYGAMRASTTGTANTFIGTNAGANWATPHGNTGIGWSALQGLSAGVGAYNTAVGYAAGSGYSAGSANGLSQSSGSYNTYLGYSSSGTTASNTFTNSTAIGAFSQAGANDVVVLGSINGANGATADTKVGIGVTAPTEKLHVNGNIRFSNALMPNNLPGTAGHVLVSQGAGVAPVWQSAATIVKTYSKFATRTLISSTTWANVTGLSQSVTTPGPAILIIMTYGSIENAGASGAFTGAEVKITQNAVDVPNAYQTVDVINSGATGVIHLWSFQTTVVIPAAGTYTFVVQAHKYAGANFNAGGNNTAPVASQNQGALTILQFDQ